MSCSNTMPPLPAFVCSPKQQQQFDEHMNRAILKKLIAQASDPNYHPPTPWMVDFANRVPLRK